MDEKNIENRYWNYWTIRRTMVFSFLIMSLNYSNEMLFFSVRKEKRSKFLKRLDLTSQYYSLNCISSLMVVKKKMFHVHRKISISLLVALANNSHDMLFVHSKL